MFGWGFTGDFQLIFIVALLLCVAVLLRIFCMGNRFMLRSEQDVYDGFILILVPVRVELDNTLG